VGLGASKETNGIAKTSSKEWEVRQHNDEREEEEEEKVVKI
jgi:hypothetical protein